MPLLPVGFWGLTSVFRFKANALRSWINTTLKAKAKASKKKTTTKRQADEDTVGGNSSAAPSAAKGPAAEFFNQLGVEMPASQEEQISTLKSLLEEDASMDRCIENAKKSVTKASHVLITKLATDDERNGKNLRTKIMKEALDAASRLQDDKNKNKESESWTGSADKPAFGIQAAIVHAQQKGDRPAPKKKAGKSDETKMVANLGKHLLR